MTNFNEPNYLDKKGHLRKAKNKLSNQRKNELIVHLGICGSNIHECTLCYELYSNLGGQSIIDIFLEKKEVV